MTKNQSSDQVGDTRSPALVPHFAGLYGMDHFSAMQAGPALKSLQSSPIADLAHASGEMRSNSVALGTCRQVLWFSFFFDGTGNNLQADEASLKHSNVAKLYRAHVRNNRQRGIYRFYIPGVGTYFPEVGDNGGSDLGLGTGKLGAERIEWALKQFDQMLLPHARRANNPLNAISEINLSAFGFSRGAALARAFINIFLEGRCEPASGTHPWRLRAGGHPVRVPFMGLFDTVASVGTPMSMNNTSVAGAAAGSVSFCIKYRLNNKDLSVVTPVHLAFAEGGRSGADPAVGWYDGHNSWGARMKIPEMVEEVRHFVAAHEIRNSFPLDSVTILERGTPRQPAHFHETVYPGVHSDVGGSYRPGEGGRSYSPLEKLGVIPLTHMYENAIAKGVPLLPRTAWEELQKRDFAIQSEVSACYNHYITKIGSMSSLGSLFNAHMALYFAWRFRSIRCKAGGDSTDSTRIERSRANFDVDIRKERAQVARLEAENNEALEKYKQVCVKRNAHIYNGFAGPSFSENLKKYDVELEALKEDQANAQDRFLQAKARLDAIPNMSSFAAMLEMYDQQLLSDVREIRRSLMGGEDPKIRAAGKRLELRPHYRGLVEAYENEFIYKRGLTDTRIIAFFDTYVHDSLAGFAKDATLPSDPRVVYVGGDEKLQYASIDGAAADNPDVQKTA